MGNLFKILLDKYFVSFIFRACYLFKLRIVSFFAHVAQLVEHILGKDEVTGSIPVVGSTKRR